MFNLTLPFCVPQRPLSSTSPCGVNGWTSAYPKGIPLVMAFSVFPLHLMTSRYCPGSCSKTNEPTRRPQLNLNMDRSSPPIRLDFPGKIQS